MFSLLIFNSNIARADALQNCQSDDPKLVVKGCTELLDDLENNELETATIFLNRGLAYENSGIYDKAITDYEAALVLSPDLEKAKVSLKRAKEKVAGDRKTCENCSGCHSAHWCTLD